MVKQQKPRKRDGKKSLRIEFEDGLGSVDLREGHDRIVDVKKQKFKNINELLDMLNKKL